MCRAVSRKANGIARIHAVQRPKSGDEDKRVGALAYILFADGEVIYRILAWHKTADCLNEFWRELGVTNLAELEAASSFSEFGTIAGNNIAEIPHSGLGNCESGLLLIAWIVR
jgi:hypothetical protein